MSLRRVLVANRGEIAIRVVRACRELGIETVAVYSDADNGAPHTRAADRAVRIGPPPPRESYLNIGAILAAARDTGCDAVHPGYGFLSENAAFARACATAGVTFVGPKAESIELMGSKIGARALMQHANVPVVPGITPSDQSDDGVLEAVRSIGFPALVKASAGGGGKGMRLLRAAGASAGQGALGDESQAVEMIGAARREAHAAFGDGTLYVERLIERPRHVEIQVFADGQGNAVHLFERECSVQRRHQKVIEESPSVALTPALRARMGEAAVRAAQAAKYRNAGTIEFLLEGSGDEARFYFLEMNTRLQVEHPVTEAVTGVDLVHAQLRVAAGEPLPWAQASLSQRGHAIECRVYAEDPASGFLPQAGRLLLYREPSGPGIRVDSGVVEGNEVPVAYDPLLAKLTVSAETREAAIDRAIAALRDFPVLGIRSNVPFLIRVLQHEAFRRGDIHTGFIDANLPELIAAAEITPAVVAAAALVGGVFRPGAAPAGPVLRPGTANHEPQTTTDDPWTSLQGFGR
jgi:acetyl-CoA carboxylase biotin carboxylase subunit